MVQFPTVKHSLYLTEKLARWPCKIKAKDSWQQCEGEHEAVCQLVSVLNAFLALVFGLLSKNEKCEKNPY